MRNNISHIVWDWNGTLLDDVDICIGILNEMLARSGRAGITKEKYLRIFGFPIRDYYLRAGLTFEELSFEELAEIYIKKYGAASAKAPLTRGAESVLGEIEALGISQSVISASERTILRSQIEERGISRYFSDILGLGDNYADGKTDIAVSWMKNTGQSPENVLFVGDTLHDLEVASHMGCRVLLICGGHQSRERLTERCGDVGEDISCVVRRVTGR